MGVDGDPSVADVPVGELSSDAMALERSGRTDHRAADSGVKAVTHFNNTVDEIEWPGAMANDIATAVMAGGTAAGRVGSTETPDTAKPGQDEAAVVALAYKPHHQRWFPDDPPADACGADPEPEPSPCRMNRANSISAPEKKSTSASCGVGSSLP
ncbi:hypothetical protein PIB30_057472 [Stylosanthes scabra]|uniref:Uncharacterized protein n=1 Tax=Stylosanthes scabra TaxID=79078 RepID=A0ABU6RKI6_9FABA|nr:hypothetical protein [Stylosanthes scabra]